MMECLLRFLRRGRAYLLVICLQFGFAGNAILSKSALNKGMCHYTFVVYRHAFATAIFGPFALFLERDKRPKMTASIFLKIMLLGLLEPVIDQNLYYAGMKYTTAAFAESMCNVLPAVAFIMAWIVRLEKVDLRKRHSQAKVLGTIVTVGGAMIITLLSGPSLKLPGSRELHNAATNVVHQENILKGGIMIACGCFCWASFVILQAITLKSYSADLSLTALICMMGTIEGSMLAFAMERGNHAVWAVHFDTKLAAALYSGIICSGLGFFFSGLIMKEKGPVFVTTFDPLSMVIVTILGFFILSEQLYLGRIIGAMVIVIGLYLVIWGKKKDPSASKPNCPNCDRIVPSDLPVVVENKNSETLSQDGVAVEFTKIELPTK